jgi:hypothetical protein
MKRVQIYHYHGKVEDWEERTGYQHLEQFPEMNFNSLCIVMENIWNQGLNVMLVHTGDDSAVLYIDNKNFKQR